MTSNAMTITDLLSAGLGSTRALTAPGATPLTYDALRRLVTDTGAVLNRQGIGRNDRIGIVLENGPQMAAAFISIAANATAAPLNPAYRADEFEFYLTDLQARLLILAVDQDSPAVAVAEKLG